MQSTRAYAPVPPEVWSLPDMVDAWAAHDIGTVYQILQRQGISQRRIAALTRQSQSEISEIMAGRDVMSHRVLTRVATGLGVPGGLPPLTILAPKPAKPAPAEPAVPVEVVVLEARSAPSPARLMQSAYIDALLESAEPISSPVPPTVVVWTGLKVRALRWARRDSVREIAANLGISDRMVSKWESGGGTMRPADQNQAALDTYLAKSDPEAHARFRGLMKVIKAIVEAGPPEVTSAGERGAYELRIPLPRGSEDQANRAAIELMAAFKHHRLGVAKSDPDSFREQI